MILKYIFSNLGAETFFWVGCLILVSLRNLSLEDEGQEDSGDEVEEIEEEEGKEELMIPLEHSDPKQLTQLQWIWSFR